MANWKIDSSTDKKWKPFISALYNSIFNENEKIHSLPDFDKVVDFGVIDEGNKVRKLQLLYKGIEYNLSIYFYNRHNGNCLAIHNDSTGRNLLQLVLDVYIEYIGDKIRIWHDGLITGIADINTEKFIQYIKNQQINLVKEENDGEFVELGILENQTLYSFTNKDFAQFISSLLLFSIYRNDIKKEYTQNETDTNPWLQIIKDYKSIVAGTQNEGEVYKWKLIAENSGRLNPSATNFAEQLRSAKFLNLVYHNGIAVLFHLLREFPLEIQECFKQLFDEKTPLQLRVSNFYEQTLAIYRRVESKLSHHQDERSIATYLTFQYPDKYTFYKNSFYKKLCDKLGIKPEKKLKKYPHYLALVKDFAADYIDIDPELIQIKRDFLTDDCYQDENNLILAQDILYQVLDISPLGKGRRYWRIGTSDEDSSYWDKMLNGNFVSIGWSRIGDLYAKEVTEKAEIINLLDKFKYDFKNNSSKSRKAGEIFNFYDTIKTGDIVLAQDGDTVLGVGEVIGDYEFNADLDFTHTRPVKWFASDMTDFLSSDGRRTTVFEITDTSTISRVKNIVNAENNISINNPVNMKENINTILYGPPGTGKTFNTINKSLEIIGVNIEGKVRKEIKAFYDEKMKEGQIVFSTFHQSMSYEDFIEGIKPMPPEPNQSLNYEIQAGIFKIACARAAYLCYKKYNQTKGGKKSNYSFEDLYNAFIESIKPLIAKNQFPIYKTITGKEVEIYEVNSQESIKARARGSVATHVAPLTQENLEKLYNKFSNLAEIENLDAIRETVQVSPRSTEFYAVFGGLKEFEKNYKPDNTIIEEDVNVDTTEDSEKVKKFTAGIYNEAIKQFGKDAEPIVLIIDEINRGNVSQIFGELITLIENDKRIGKPEALEVILPYSKAKFGVPPNLYLLGTMNTADRSVEALDTALRRRFSFIEMMPVYNTIEINIGGIKLSDLLFTINKRLAYLINEDHQIGHSYFISVDTEEKLRTVFKNNIIPLLKEYFYNDVSKIQLVLGDGFVTKDKSNKPNFAVSDQDIIDKDVYKLELINDDFNIIVALIKLKIEAIA